MRSPRCLPVATEAGLAGTLPPADAPSAAAAGAAPSALTLELSQELELSLDDLAAIDAEGRALITDHGAGGTPRAARSSGRRVRAAPAHAPLPAAAPAAQARLCSSTCTVGAVLRSCGPAGRAVRAERRPARPRADAVLRARRRRQAPR